MRIFTSRPAIAVAAAAMLSMTASPAMARSWHRHHRNHIDGGDVLAGVLIVGGIAAIAAAASNANKQKRNRDYRYPDNRNYPDYRYPDRNYRDYREPAPRYGEPSGPSGGPPYSDSWRDNGSMDGAVDTCVGEVERSSRDVDTVDSVSREDNGWRVDGRVEGGRYYSCSVDRDGRVRRVTVDGRAVI